MLFGDFSADLGRETVVVWRWSSGRDSLPSSFMLGRVCAEGISQEMLCMDVGTALGRRVHVLIPAWIWNQQQALASQACNRSIVAAGLRLWCVTISIKGYREHKGWTPGSIRGLQ